MSKKWITILVAAVIGALLVPTAAFANCRVDVITTLAITDASTPAFTGDPVPLPTGDNVSRVAPVAFGGAVTGNTINAEGQAERIQDILVTDNAAGNPCFGAVGNAITFSVNALVTSPTPGAGVPSAPANIDVYDSAGIGGLGVSANSSIAIGGGNTQQTNITVTVTHQGTAGDLWVTGGAGAAYRVKNIRIDATSISGGTVSWSANIAANANAFALVSFPNSVSGLAGTAASTITGKAGMVNIGIGTQNSGSGLTGQFAQTPNMTEGANGTFRVAAGSCATAMSGTTAAAYNTAKGVDSCASGVANDVATVATSLVFAVSGIPSGVTLNFPSTMTTSALAAGGPSLTWTNTSRGATPFSFTAATGSTSGSWVYDTTTNQAGAQATPVAFESADNADAGTPTGTAVGGTTNPNCVVSGSSVISNNLGNVLGGTFNCDANPKIGITVGNPSGQGTSTIRVAFGRGSSSRFTGDDVAASGTYPVYTSSARELVSTTAGNRNTFFVINPTRTTLLFPYATTFGNFNTGIAVVNTCTDTGVFLKASGAPTTAPTCTTSGALQFFFVGVNAATGAAYSGSLSTDLANGGVAIPAASCPQANLDPATGRLVAGKAFACGASALLGLVSGAPAQFTGYVMVVLQSNNGHGFAVQFNALSAPYAADKALVLSSGSGARNGCGAGDCGLGQ